MSNFVSLLLERRVTEAVQAAASVAPLGNAREFVASQASERAYALFRYSLEERMEALREAGVCMQIGGEHSAIIDEQRKKLINVIALLKAVSELSPDSSMSARDWQILGRATGYCGLLSRCSTQIYPTLARQNSLVMQIPKLSLLIHRDLNYLGPQGPLETEGVFDAVVFKDFAIKKTRGVEDWLTGIVRLASDTKDRKVVDACVQAVEADDINIVLNEVKKAELRLVLDRALKRL
jgi:hypothetical protein